MYLARQRHTEKLSMLARGTGLLDGGVEIQCFTDSTREYSLSGQSFLKPSPSTEGQSAKIFKARTLALPKTYVTRRGQMVLFTAPEDMVIGGSCSVHARTTEVSKQAASNLKTTKNLINSAMCYNAETESSISDAEMSALKPGSFTSTYLASLANATKRSTTTTKESPCNDGTSIQHVESDSGFESSSHPTVSISGRLSTLSHHTDSTGIVIPDGISDNEDEQAHKMRISNENSSSVLNETAHALRPDLSPAEKQEDSADTNDRKTITSKELADIIFSIPKTTISKASPKITSSKITKKKSSSTQKQPKKKVKAAKDVEPAVIHVSSEKSDQKKIPKPKRKNKKLRPSSANESSIDLHPSDKSGLPLQTKSNAETANNSNDKEISANPVIQVDGTGTATTSDSNDDRIKVNQSDRALERRLEIERKRSEKRRLELEKKSELEKQKALLEMVSKEEDKEVLVEEQEHEESDESETDNFTAGKIGNDLQRRLSQFEELRSQPMASSPLHDLPARPHVVTQEGKDHDDTLKKARELKEQKRQEEETRHRQAEEERTHRQAEEEKHQHDDKEEQKQPSLAEQRRKETLQKESLHKENLRKEATIKEAEKLQAKEELNYKMRLDLEIQKHNQSITPHHIFSYFRHRPVPLAKTTKKKPKKRKK